MDVRHFKRRRRIRAILRCPSCDLRPRDTGGFPGSVPQTEREQTISCFDWDDGPYYAIRFGIRFCETTPDDHLHQGRHCHIRSRALVDPATRSPWRLAWIIKIHSIWAFRTKLEEPARSNHGILCAIRGRYHYVRGTRSR